MQNLPLTKKFAAGIMAFSLWSPVSFSYPQSAVTLQPSQIACPFGSINCCTPFTPACERLHPGPIVAPQPPRTCRFGFWDCCYYPGCGPTVVPTPPPVPSPYPGIYCPQILAPVCGVDGRTYDNSCVAQHQNGVPVAHAGACGGLIGNPVAPTYTPLPLPRSPYIEQYNTQQFDVECDPHGTVCIPIPKVYN